MFRILEKLLDKKILWNWDKIQKKYIVRRSKVKWTSYFVLTYTSSLRLILFLELGGRVGLVKRCQVSSDKLLDSPLKLPYVCLWKK